MSIDLNDTLPSESLLEARDASPAQNGGQKARSKPNIIFNQGERTTVFIDGASLYAMTKMHHFDMDYYRFLQFLRANTRLIRAYYYTALVYDENDYCPITPLADWLSYNGWEVFTKEAREYVDAQTGNKKIKTDISVELATDMLENSGTIEHVILCSANGDFTRTVQALQRRGVRVTVIGTIEGATQMMADSLRRQADSFVDLITLKPNIQKA